MTREAQTMTRHQVRNMWDAMTDEQRKAFTFLAHLGIERKAEAQIEVIETLFDLSLIQRAKNLLNGQDIIVLTDNGKKLAKVIA
jgi:hypothetical protein